ncbi:Dehydroquinate synthase-like protein [Lentithecium fluviatile CBS 122367]|uniref:Dehydroquinate synthase-like protein n=1 Tax=Lentithecium fluviatile CBS 122367 TaxID=1168545 RepID=A0A6G1JCK7_9PLEO|nr:Dehydroquinate synthase-like protein [Lentithecium fluviatile CBS 122367]
MESRETYMPAFDEPPGTNLAGISIKGLKLPSPYISYGRPYHASCAKYIKDTFHASKNSDKLDKLVEAISKENVVGVKKGMTPHTPWSDILSIAAECREAPADCVVTLGAGSLTDGSKLVVLCLANNISEPKQLARYSVESTDTPSPVKQPTVPLITIPTSLSDGEFFSLAGGTDDSMNHKQGFLHSGMGSKLINLDPELYLTTPEYHWLSTGIRSADHCGLRLLVPSLLMCKENPKDLAARHRCPLGVPHGITSYIMCPAVMKYNIKHGSSNPEIPRLAGVLKAAGLNTDSNDLGDALDVIVRTLGLPRTLKELQVSSEVISALSKRALDDFWAPTNPVPLVEANQVQEILEVVV